MAKQQTGLRIDRVLFKQFQQLAALEKLRPGEAAETLIRAAIEAKSITRVQIQGAGQDNTVCMFDDALFRSRLSRLKTSLEQEERFWKETGREVEEKESDYFLEELTELGRRNVSQELVKEFETILTNADRQYEEMQRKFFEKEIDDYKT